MSRDQFLQQFGSEDLATQRELLLMYADTCGDHFTRWLGSLANGTQPATATQGSEAEAFFDRSMHDAALNAMADLTGTYADGGFSVTVVMAQAWWIWANNLLAGGPAAGYEMAAMLGGWRVAFPDGAIAGIAIYNGEQGPYVDAFLRLPDSAPENLVNPHIQPRKQLDAAFVFEVPNHATYKVFLIYEQPQ